MGQVFHRRGVCRKSAYWLDSGRHGFRRAVLLGADLAGVALLVIALLIGVGVLMHVFGISRLATLETPLWLIGRRITFNTLMGLQTLLFAFAVMLTISLAWALDRQVRVDFFYQRFSRAGQATVNLLGNLCLALPFLYLILDPAYEFAHRSWRIGESSTDGGLAQLWVLKALLPAGVLLMLLVSLWWTLRSAATLVMEWCRRD